MTDTAIAEPGIGHNNPPPDAIAQLLAPIAGALDDLGLRERADRVAGIVRTANLWHAALGATGIQDAVAAGRCDDFLAQIRAEVDLITARQAELRKPHDEAIAKVIGTLRPLGDCLRICVELLKPLKAGWLTQLEARQKAEAKRLADEAAAVVAAAAAARQKAEEAKGDVVENTVAADQLEQRAADLQAQAAAAADAKPQVRGEFTGRATGFRTTWSAEITDVLKALRHYRADPRITEALQKCADADARRLKEATDIPGIKAVSKKTV